LAQYVEAPDAEYGLRCVQRARCAAELRAALLQL